MREWITSQFKTVDTGGGNSNRDRRSDFDLHPDLDIQELMLRNREPVPAAVLIPLVDRPEGMTVLLTKRTDHLHDHAGQVSFPGGRTEDEDDGPVATAIRETQEEIGLDPSFIDVIGSLDVYLTVTGFRVTPVVGIVRPDFVLELDEFEVAEAFEVPLGFVFDPSNHERHNTIWKGEERHYYVLPYGSYHIWGATAGMLVNLYDRLHHK